MQGILRNKNYNVIDSDFLKYSPETNFDLIIMNPPFDNGVKHLLKAIEISNGAEIRCLLNTSSIENLYSKERELLAKIMEHLNGTIENLGSCFIDSERSTKVEVSLIKIPKKARESLFDFNLNSNGEKNYSIDDIQNNQLEQTDVFASLVNRYNKMKEISAKILMLNNELKFYAKGLISSNSHPDIILSDMIKHVFTYEQIHERFISEIRKQSWENILKKTKISQFVTKKVKESIDDKMDKQSVVAFTEENIDSLLRALIMNTKEIQQNCVEEAFDLLTRFDSTNIVHVEGWKTNDKWMIHKRCIIPCADIDVYDNPYVKYYYEDHVIDIEKALCFIVNKKYNDIYDNTIVGMSKNRLKVPLYFGQWYESEFFRFKFFKKGTMHLEFKDLSLLQRFNVIACQCKNWLPADYGKSTNQR